MAGQGQYWDEQVLSWCNSLFDPSTDVFWLTVTKTVTWVPLYALLLLAIYRKSDLSTFIFRLAVLTFGVLIWDQGANLFKHLVARPRPCHVMEGLRVLVHCSPFGFFSAHAANSFGLAFLLRSWLGKPIFIILILAAVIQSFSRLHVGVHYPSDLIAGAFWGGIVSFGLLKIENQWRSNHS